MPRKDIRKIYMKMALEISEMSYAERKKVGAVIVKDGRVISLGYNGTPKGFDNSCEYYECGPNNEAILVSKPEVIHAECNAICKVARSSDSAEGSELYVTMEPCIECAKLIIQSGISKVYYYEDYRLTDGSDLLRKAGIEVEQIKCLENEG